MKIIDQKVVIFEIFDVNLFKLGVFTKISAKLETSLLDV